MSGKKIEAVLKFESGEVITHSSTLEESGTKFKPDFYTAKYDRDGDLHINTTKLEELHEPFSSESNERLLVAIKAFFKDDIAAKVKSMGFNHKMGILMYGDQGTGKTSIANYVSDLLVKNKDAIVFICDDMMSVAGARDLAESIRKIQDNPIVFICDEFDSMLTEHEAYFKRFLDGSYSIHNSLVIASTNYIDKIPETIKDRPSRFRLCEKIIGIKDRTIMFGVVNDILSKLDEYKDEDAERTRIVNKILDLVTVSKGWTTIDRLKNATLDEVLNMHLPEATVKTVIGFGNSEEEDFEDDENATSSSIVFKDRFNDVFDDEDLANMVLVKRSN